MRARWEGDTRGEGVADGSLVGEGIEELRQLASLKNWIAEEPEMHLLPHLRAACEQANSMFALESSQIDQDGAFVVEVRPRDQSFGLGQIRAAVLCLIGQIAETGTYVRQRREPLSFEVLTGVVGNSPFASHGHLLILRIVGYDARWS